MSWFMVWPVVGLLVVWAATVGLVSSAPIRQRLGGLISQWARLRRHRPRFDQATATGPPIVEIAARVHRLETWLDTYEQPDPLPGTAMKLAATIMAYDKVLAQASDMLQIPQSLDSTHGVDREAERLRVQASLAAAGFVLSSRHRTGI